MYTTVNWTPSCDTAILASGDIIATTEIIRNVFPSPSHGVVLVSLELIDADDQGAALDVYFFSGSGTLGTENSAPSISDANALNFLARVPVATGDYTDLGGVRVVNLKNLWTVLTPVSGSCDMYGAIVNGAGTPTYTASGLSLRLGLDIPRL